MNFRYRLFLSLVLVFYSAFLQGIDVRRCYVASQMRHAKNQVLLSHIINNELSTVSSNASSSEKASFLSSRIKEIAQKLLKDGFITEAYQIPPFDQNAFLSFYFFPLWEGKSSDIPLTFVVAVWPPEKIALKYQPDNPMNRFYCSCIHKHPISCAIACLKGVMTQQNYTLAKGIPVEKKKVELLNEDKFSPGEGDIDDNTKMFIHRLICKHDDNDPALTLHAYGASTKDEVIRIFNETSEECEYTLP